MAGVYKETEGEKVLRQRVDELEARCDALLSRLESVEAATGLFATDRDLDGTHGDPAVKFAPRDYRGPDMKGRQYSRCTPEFLDILAESLAYSAANPKEGKEKFAKYNAIDAKRARSWARRLRSGWKAPSAPEAPEFPGDPMPTVNADFTADFEAPSFDAPAFVDDSEIPF